MIDDNILFFKLRHSILHKKKSFTTKQFYRFKSKVWTDCLIFMVLAQTARTYRRSLARGTVDLAGSIVALHLHRRNGIVALVHVVSTVCLDSQRSQSNTQ